MKFHTWKDVKSMFSFKHYFEFFYFQFNFVGRVIGPRGMTLREVETTTGCKLLVRGKGSMKDKKLVSFFIVRLMIKKIIKHEHAL